MGPDGANALALPRRALAGRAAGKALVSGGAAAIGATFAAPAVDGRAVR